MSYWFNLFLNQREVISYGKKEAIRIYRFATLNNFPNPSLQKED
jgi:hypothetical protein